MLNDLLPVERGALQAGIEMTRRHPDIKDARRVPTLLVRLGEAGDVVSVRPVPASTRLWTLRDGQHNSFPFVQPKQPLWAVSEDDDRRKTARDTKRVDRREALLELTREAVPNEKLRHWPGPGLIGRLAERRQDLAALETTNAAAVPATIDRFLFACGRAPADGPQRLLRDIAAHLVDTLQQTSASDWLDLAVAILAEGTGAFFFDAASDGLSLLDRRIVAHVSAALQSQRGRDTGAANGRCALTGEVSPLISTAFPQPNLSLLGQTFLFARNREGVSRE